MKKHNYNNLMKKLILTVSLFAGALMCEAQTVIDNFNIGPYEVDYMGQGDVKYRLRDNIDLYDYFELERDTVIMARESAEPVRHAIQLSGRVGANRYASKDIGIEGVWKQSVAPALYFNGGVSVSMGLTDFGEKGVRRTMFEAGVPLQLEWSRLQRRKSSLYGIVGVAPCYYTTLSASNWGGGARYDEVKKSGLLVAPSLEFGGNIPVGGSLLRIGVYGMYKINCTPSDLDVYKMAAGRMFLGAKIGVVL